MDNATIRADLDNVIRRCDIKESDVRDLRIRLAIAETKIEKLEKTEGIQDNKLVGLSAWKNKALGWLAAIGALTMLIIEYLKGDLFK